MIDKNKSHFLRKNVLNSLAFKKTSEKEIVTSFSEKKLSAIEKLQKDRI